MKLSSLHDTMVRLDLFPYLDELRGESIVPPFLFF